MKYEAEATVAGALRGGIYDAETETFFCHAPKPMEFKVKRSEVNLFYPWAVSKSGDRRVSVYINESDDPACFTGRCYQTGELSSLWERAKFEPFDEGFYDVMNTEIAPQES